MSTTPSGIPRYDALAIARQLLERTRLEDRPRRIGPIVEVVAIVALSLVEMNARAESECRSEH